GRFSKVRGHSFQVTFDVTSEPIRATVSPPALQDVGLSRERGLPVLDGEVEARRPQQSAERVHRMRGIRAVVQRVYFVADFEQGTMRLFLRVGVFAALLHKRAFGQK